MSVDPRRTQPFCTPRCYRECRCSRWPDYKNRFGEYVVPHDEGQEYYEKVLSYGPIAYWPLWETVGPTAEDLINSPAQDGTYVGPVPNSTLGPDGANNAPFFDGINDRVNIYSVALNAAFSGLEGTAMIWHKVDAVGTWTDGTFRFGLILLVDGNNSVQVCKSNNNNEYRWQYRANADTDIRNRATAAPIDWFCIHLTWSDSGNQAIAYWNGVQEGAVLTPIGTWVGPLLNTQCMIGLYQTTPLYAWKGWLAHCAIWDRVLTPAEIVATATI